MHPRQPTPALYALLLNPPGEFPSLEFCRDTGVLGVGWGVGAEPLDWQIYRQRAIPRDGAVHAAVQEVHDLPDGSLIWTQDPANKDYYLAQVIGPWQYLHSHAALSARVQNVRPVRMVACESASQVPSTIIDGFIGDWAVQRIPSMHTAWRSAFLFAKLAGGPGQQQLTLDEILTIQLSDEQVRNLVCRYLHWRYGYPLRLPTLQSVFGSWEYVVPDGYRRRTIVRARRGFSPVPRDAGSIPARAVNRLFVFSPTGTYGPDPDPNFTEIEYHEIVDFIRSQPSPPLRSRRHTAYARSSREPAAKSWPLLKMSANTKISQCRRNFMG